MHRRHVKRAGFTLIELLVVIAIMAILAAILMPAFSRARNAARRTRALQEVKQLEAAFLSYQDEYGRFPTGLVGDDTATAEDTSTGIQVNKPVIDMLSGQNINNMNPKLIPFLDIAEGALHPSTEAYVDPWDRRQPGDSDPNTYKYMLDFNNDGQVHIWFTDQNGETNLPRTVAVWSRGIDHRDQRNSQEDDVQSWR